MTERWEVPGYAQIVRADARPDGRLTVLFSDGSSVETDGKRLLPPEAKEPRWDAIKVDEYGDFIFVPTAGDAIDIPADRIRVLSDPAFAEHRAALAQAEAKRIGQRLRVLREQRGLTAREVARRAHVSPISMSRIELGHHDVVLTTLAQILAAMGCSFDDLEAPVASVGTPASEGTGARER
jgi:DNA-binding XRE family transcriptional regulator